ncbi:MULTISPECIES: fumarylacetoacetate hydrolase family protein [unclassified Sphingomonas]|uniref:fumarylacetoacetate hydrolase family protein n=1 Tax=unclassified Sphingomonas TaxID=196159 RepID=UPI0006FAF347|nr:MULTISPECIES: fumarylacetoacetate hydrolase family protein [unclassified Sphingomonas]KQX19128.1 hypothetical protein ASD17_11205 [Sphingomonas sp. Root1294]KQY65329.1 hypothetical protein ASD39_14400 [Sphingomonas sp. Root50]KRB95376.1 hypothetical protein ASE22_05655 [Sphingomonas sp. Root720]
MIYGTAYGVALNDRQQLESLGDDLLQPPYRGLPVAPIVYIKPRNCFALGGASVPIPRSLDAVAIAPTIAVHFGRDVTEGDDPWAGIAAACLALDVSQPHDSYYRPAIRERCRDRFLPLGDFASFDAPLEMARIETYIDEVPVHCWAMDRLARPIGRLVSDLAAFMTLKAGDLLLVGLPGDAPTASAGQAIRVTTPGLPSLHTSIVWEAAQ